MRGGSGIHEALEFSQWKQTYNRIEYYLQLFINMCFNIS